MTSFKGIKRKKVKVGFGVELNFEAIRVTIALAGTILAARQDWFTSFIDDRITVVMITAGVILDLLTFNQGFIAYGFGIAAIIGLIGYFLYRKGQFGGGDVLLFMGIGLLLPYPPSFLKGYSALALSIIPFVASVFVTSSLYAMLGSALLYGKYLSERKVKENKLFLTAFLAVLAIAFLSFLPYLVIIQKMFFSAIALSTIFLLVFRKEIHEQVVVRQTKLGDIEDEDILETGMMDRRIVKKYGLERVLTKKQVGILGRVGKREKIKEFPVCRHLPRFGPYVLLALLSSLIIGDVLSYFLFYK